MRNSRHKNDLERFFGLEKHVKWFLLAAVTAAIIMVLFPSLIISQRSYVSGDVVERNIKATKDFLFEDKPATEKQRVLAVERILSVYDHNTALTAQLVERVNTAFDNMRDVIAAGSLLAVNPESIGEIGETTPFETAAEPAPDDQIAVQSVHDLVIVQKPTFEKGMGVTFSTGAFAILEKEAFSVDISNDIIHILSEILDNGVVANKELLLRESEKGITLRQIGEKTERTVTNLKQFYGLDQSKVMVRIVGQPLLKDVNYNLRNLIVDVVQRLIVPNITLNLSLIHISEPTRPPVASRMPSSA